MMFSFFKIYNQTVYRTFDSNIWKIFALIGMRFCFYNAYKKLALGTIFFDHYYELYYLPLKYDPTHNFTVIWLVE